MSFVKTNIYVFSCVLFLVHGYVKTYMVLTLRKWPDDGPVMKFKYVKYGTEYFYSYEYSEKNGDEVYIACMPSLSVRKGILKWEIHTKKNHTSCMQESSQQLNYITKLDAAQNGNRLICKLTANNTRQASAQVTFRCLNCNNSVKRHLKAACYSNSTISTYVNGVYKNKNAVITANKNQELHVYCQIRADNEHYLSLETNTYRGQFQLKIYGTSVIMYKVNMTDQLENQKISCQKRHSKTGSLVAENQILFLLKNDFSIEIEKNNENLGSTYDHVTELIYKDNDTVTLTCTWKGSADIPLVIEKNGQFQKIEHTGGRIKFHTNPTREDANITCLLKEDQNILDNITIIMKYTKPEDIVFTTTTESFYAPGTNETTASSSELIRDIEWVGLGLGTIFLVVAITYIACKYKFRKAVAPTVLENTVSNDVQNIYETQDRPILEPTYAGPADDLHEYSYTYNLKTTQDTYSAPFVPTIEEMYTKPTPKNLNAKKDLAYLVPGKITYANLQGAQRNQTEPGYSYVSTDTSDTASEIYTYCSPTGYSRPK